MPVARDTTSAMSSAITSGGALPAALSGSSSSSLRCVDLLLQLARALVVLGRDRLVALALEPAQVVLERAACPSSFVFVRRRTRALAWSIRSIALSGRKRSRDVAVGQLGGRDERLVA